MARSAGTVWGGAKGALPVAVVQQCDRCGRRRVVACLEQSPSGGLEPHRPEEVPGNKLAVDNGRSAVARQAQPAGVGNGSAPRKEVCFCYLAKHWLGERAARRILSAKAQIVQAIACGLVAMNVR